MTKHEWIELFKDWFWEYENFAKLHQAKDHRLAEIDELKQGGLSNEALDMLLLSFELYLRNLDIPGYRPKNPWRDGLYNRLTYLREKRNEIRGVAHG